MMNYSVRIYRVDFSFDLYGIWPEQSLNSVISSELLSHSESNVRVLDYVNGQIFGPSYDIINIDYPEPERLPTKMPTFCSAIYDHSPNKFYSPFQPDNELSKWSMAFKVRVTFKQPISRGQLKKAAEYRWDYDNYSSRPAGGCHIKYGLDQRQDHWPKWPYVDDGFWWIPVNPTQYPPKQYQSFPGSKVKFEFNPYNPNSEGNGTRTRMNSEH